ncbi:MAG: amino acid ABC transporter ATP-binding protein [Eubacteriaceae bacterium]|nr:amino acid ABC transporter ATP-binding protein [Eubacteriaceae bacterium]
MAVVEARNIYKRYGDVQVLSDVSVSVREGEVVAVIGPSGSGKSTLLRCLNQLTRIDSGSIEVCGETMVHTDESGICKYAEKAKLHEIQLKTGLVFQNFQLFPHFSVLKNIMDAPVQVLKLPEEEVRSKAIEILGKLDLVDKQDVYPYQLSGGQAQRVSIARALALSPAVLFFDEPTSALDPELTIEILKVMKDLAKEKMTMMVVTHEMAFAQSVADRIVFMDKGVVIEEGSPQKIFTSPDSERVKQFLQYFSE